MNRKFQQVILNATGAEEVFHLEDIQPLWSGYGKIVRLGLKGAERDSIVVKHVELPEQRFHPRGWNTDISHQRKVKSYRVELAWYRHWAHLCDQSCRIPEFFPFDSQLEFTEDDDEFLIVLEDLDASGYPDRKESASIDDMKLCISWLANFHATFLQQTSQRSTNNQPSAGLWEVGTYWHLDTRPDELAILDDVDLKNAAVMIDQRLTSAQYQTIVHGDAKLANFCFSSVNHRVAAVDFQYVGGGCGMKDLAYFIGSCLFEEDCELYETELLDDYFLQLCDGLKARHSLLDFNAVEEEWRDLYYFAWTDFHRFLKGWSPGHWKIHGYSERIASEVIARINL